MELISHDPVKNREFRRKVVLPLAAGALFIFSCLAGVKELYNTFDIIRHYPVIAKPLIDYLANTAPDTLNKLATIINSNNLMTARMISDLTPPTAGLGADLVGVMIAFGAAEVSKKTSAPVSNTK